MLQFFLVLLFVAAQNAAAQRWFVKDINGANALEVRKEGDLTRYYIDEGTGADGYLSVWEPAYLSENFYLLGQRAQSNWGPRDGDLLIGKDVTDNEERPALILPVGYNGPVWTDRGTLGYTDVGFWNIVCPTGYAPVGDVVNAASYNPPPPSKFRCVREDLTEDCAVNSSPLWSDRGSWAETDGSVWEILPYEGASGYFKVHNHHDIPPNAGQAKCLRKLVPEG